MSVDPLNILAGIAAARGDLDGASAAYEALLERCRAAGQRSFVLFILQRLAALRAKQGNDAAADGLYEEATACSFNPSVSADVMVGQAAVARRLGDLARARALLDAAGAYYRNVGLPAGQTGVLAGLAWWALSAGKADEAMVFAADACQAAAASGDPAVQLLADTAVAAVRALADPTRPNARGLHRARSAARPEFVVRQPHQFHRRAGCRRARGPPRASGSLTSVSPQRRVRPARQTGIHAASTRSALQPA